MASLLSDPHAQELVRQLGEARLQAEGADVLAPLPAFH
jgi:hypothetical protein